MALSPKELSSVEEAIYDQSFRTLDEQARVLEGLRSRAGTLAGVATITTGFVGGLVWMSGASPSSSVSPLAWTAIGLYASVIVLSLSISLPSRRSAFAHHPELLLAAYADPAQPRSLSEFRRIVASYNGRNYRANDRQLARLSASFVVASVVFVTELVLWLWMLAT